MTTCSTFKTDYEEIWRWKWIQSLFPVVPYSFYADYFDDIKTFTEERIYSLHIDSEYNLVLDEVKTIKELK